MTVEKKKTREKKYGTWQSSAMTRGRKKQKSLAKSALP